MKSTTKPVTASITKSTPALERQQVIRAMIIAMLTPAQFLYERNGEGCLMDRHYNEEGIEVTRHAPDNGELLPLLEVVGRMLDEIHRDDDPDWGEGGG